MSAVQRTARYAMLVVPGVAIALACAMLLLTRTRSGTAARMFGGPPGPDGVAAWRVVAVERSLGVETPLRGANLQLVASDGARSWQAQGVTDDEGAWEARVALGTSLGSVRVEIRTTGPQPHVIGFNQMAIGVPAWQASFRTDPLPLPGQASGDLAISVSPSRGILAPPYPEELVVQVRDSHGAAPLSGVAVSAQGQGIAVDAAQPSITDAHGRARVLLHVVEHDAKLQLQARSPTGQQGSWTGGLPVMPGGMWVEPGPSAQGRIRIQSPVAHKYAYVTSLLRNARLFSTRVPLQPESGGATGAVDIPQPPADAWILISPDPPGWETEALAWPVPAPDGGARPSAELRTPLLLDGVPAAEHAVRAQALRTRARALTVLGLAALLEAALLWWRAMQARDELQALLAREPELDSSLRSSIDSGRAFWLRMMLGAAIIGFGFFGVALVTWLGTG
jgi:hypothetical protein